MRPLILITNDDSVNAPGLMHLVDFVNEAADADVIVVAPATPQSGMSSALTVSAPLRINECPDYHGARVFTVSGTPVDCVKLALDAIVPRTPDYLFSGINHGTNAGTAIINSGTMGAVLEACMNDIPSVGFSLLHHSLKADFNLSKEQVKKIIKTMMSNPLPHKTCLNVNIPAQVVPKGIRVCRGATGHWTEEYIRYTDPSGSPFYWLTGKFVNDNPEATDTDIYWLDHDYVSVVPVTPDQTNHAAIPAFSQIYNH